jgi:hypothetical protein
MAPNGLIRSWLNPPSEMGVDQNLSLLTGVKSMG